MPRGVVGLLAAVSAAMAEVTSLAHGVLLCAAVLDAAAAVSGPEPPRRPGHPVPKSRTTGGRIIRRTGRMALGIGLRPYILAAVTPAWQPGRIHQLAKMRLIDLIALYQSMLQSKTGEHDQVARATAGGWTKDQVITAIRNLEAPYEEVGGWKRAMEVIGQASGVQIPDRGSLQPAHERSGTT
jgi:hypothetical protein